MGLSNYQLVLLDNLIYLDTITTDELKTIGEVVNMLLYNNGNEANGIGTGTITTDCHGCYQPDNPEAQNCMMTEKDWIEVLMAIKADETLCSLTIHSSAEDVPLKMMIFSSTLSPVSAMARNPSNSPSL